LWSTSEVNSTKPEKPVQNTKGLGYISIAILVIFLVVVVVRGVATFDGENHPGLDYLFFIGLVFGLIFFATLAVKFLFIGDDKDD
jgi:hypothetical protein